MTKRAWAIVFLAAAAAPLLGGPAPAGDEGGGGGGDGLVRFPYLRVDVRGGALEADGRVCLQRGLIEVFACTHYGKVHEAVLVLDCRPEHLQTGLLLLGMKERRGQVRALGEGAALEGERAVVTVAWTDPASGEEVAHRAEDLILDIRTGATMQRCGFVFTGSRFIRIDGKERFAANAGGQLIVTYHDPDAILDNPLPEGADDTVYYANSSVLPAVGTPVRVRIVPAAGAPAGAPEARVANAAPSAPTGTAAPAGR